MTARPRCALLLLGSMIAAGGCRAFDTAGPLHVVAFGDSMTAGPTARCYPDFLAEALDGSGASVISAGVSGETSADGLRRLPKVLRSVRCAGRGVLLYWEGGNDINRFIRRHDRWLRHDPRAADYPLTDSLEQVLNDVQRNLTRAVRQAQRRRMGIFLVTYPPVRASLLSCDAMPGGFLLPAQAERANGYVGLLNDRIRRAAALTGAGVVDPAAHAEAFAADPAHYHDCIHPSEAGQRFIAALVTEALRAAGLLGRYSGPSRIDSRDSAKVGLSVSGAGSSWSSQ